MQLEPNWSIPLAAFAVAVIGLSHSCVDFSLRIPGYAIVMLALVGAGLARSFTTRSSAISTNMRGNGHKIVISA